MDFFCYAVGVFCLVAAFAERKDRMRMLGFLAFGGLAIAFGMAMTEGMSVRR